MKIQKTEILEDEKKALERLFRVMLGVTQKIGKFIQWVPSLVGSKKS